MKRTIKRALATVSVMAMLVSGVCTTNMTTFAAENDSSITLDSGVGTLDVNHTYAWKDIKSVTRLDEGFSLNTSKSVTISFCNCTEGAAVVTLYQYGQASAIRTINIPESTIPTQYITLTLAKGSYYFTVTPQTGYEETSGSVYVQRADGVTETT